MATPVWKLASVQDSAMTGAKQNLPNRAANIRLLIGGGMQDVMDDLGPMFERTTGNSLSMTVATASKIPKLLQAGHVADVVIITRQVIDRLANEGWVVADSVTDVACERVGVAVPKSGNRPDISTSVAFKQALISAESIACGNPAEGGNSAVIFAEILERLNVADVVQSKLVFARSSPIRSASVGEVLESGEAELGVQAVQLLMRYPGIDILGPLPDDLQVVTKFSAAITTNANSKAGSGQLLHFLHGPAARAVIKVKGMEPC
jgi:molybdate transport system substrate-binding protein